ncbi:hypothetical protein BASA81_000694 [Batrachochytrium salamandrivorans]|nr:hypothetical protein BASA81_000694 [Batrachochytrium salamandrivorans]
MDYEAESLQHQNKLLRLELEDLKRRVEILREQRGIESDNERENEDLLLRLENDLLRAQLKEQQEFLEGCRLLAIPQIISPSPKPSRHLKEHHQQQCSPMELMQQGSENALTQLFLLVSQCQIASDFQPMKLPPHCFQSAVPGLTVTCCMRKSAMEEQHNGVCTVWLRVDGCFPNISPDNVAQGYWTTWTDAEAYADTFTGFFDRAPVATTTSTTAVNDKDVVSGRTPVPFVLRELMQNKSAEGETVVNLYREFPSHKERADEPEDWVYCLTKVKREVALSTLAMAAELNPGVTMRRDQHTRRVLPQQSADVRVRKRTKGPSSSSSAATQLLGRQECIVLARNVMRGLPSNPNATSSSPTATQAHEEKKTAEGLFVWQDEVLVDNEVECKEGREIVRQRVPAARAAAFISFSSDLRFVQATDLLSALVDVQGRATERFSKLIDSYYMRLGAVQ